mmetsp:Transcript_35802/g.89088  ORF Transcript_35802/g.89088 Transcript_35802/m.89088 type:complete len:80 (-) Transcript_35802:1219-1458(-)
MRFAMARAIAPTGAMRTLAGAARITKCLVTRANFGVPAVLLSKADPDTVSMHLEIPLSFAMVSSTAWAVTMKLTNYVST